MPEEEEVEVAGWASNRHACAQTGTKAEGVALWIQPCHSFKWYNIDLLLI
jgi:hypothetical protein